MFVSTCTSEKAGMLCMSHGQSVSFVTFHEPLEEVYI